jgi:DNA-binding response OmpR family regulator
VDKKTILIIDDDPDSITFVALVLAREGFNVISAEDGEAGLKRAMTDLPDLIVLDVQMPKINGFEVFKRLHSSDTTKDIPVIVLTGIGDKIGHRFSGDDMKAFYGEGPRGYVEKPVSPEELLKVVNASL